MCFPIFLFHFKHRYRLTSASDEENYEEEQPLYDDYEEHMQYMAARERLQEFPGRIPPRKKRDTINTQPRKSRVSKFFLLCLQFFFLSYIIYLIQIT